MHRHVFLFGTLSLLVACVPRSYNAIAVPVDGLVVTYTVQSLFGFQSDWSRTIRVTDGVTEISQELFEDTGWWRGSHLYRHKSGVYVIHEGQIGCFGFKTEPLSFHVPAYISCEKSMALEQEQDGASRYYANFIYLGRFVETPNSPDGTPISFVSADEAPEVELPDVL
jgi:hypothetical protein